MNPMNIKINNTEDHGDYIVSKGKLVFINLDHDRLQKLKESGGKFVELKTYTKTYYWIEPIIISETEEIKEGDWVYNANTKEIYEINHDSNVSFEYKILALPEHFSDKHLQAIVDKKMRDNSEVLIKVYCDVDTNSYIDLNQQNHITLFPVKEKPMRHQPLSVKDIYGNIWNIGDKVKHSGVADEVAVIESFYWDDILAEIRANTTKGNAGLDYLTKVSVK